MIWSCPIIRDEEEDRCGFLVDLRVVLTLDSSTATDSLGTLAYSLSAGHSFLFSVGDL